MIMKKSQNLYIYRPGPEWPGINVDIIRGNTDATPPTLSSSFSKNGALGGEGEVFVQLGTTLLTPSRKKGPQTSPIPAFRVQNHTY